ncbi:hypothetical protein Acr_28g0007430 [Actinidia rufa]|uniref:Uncharacterized protein n=1 Tax=Actinidia rufa TaxID=165716 RepID=A0A7J0HAJ1_9ERIC|nr:hypothetical protein Acr_28g0007430 [Actinidia rufa]
MEILGDGALGSWRYPRRFFGEGSWSKFNEPTLMPLQACTLDSRVCRHTIIGVTWGNLEKNVVAWREEPLLTAACRQKPSLGGVSWNPVTCFLEETLGSSETLKREGNPWLLGETWRDEPWLGETWRGEPWLFALHFPWKNVLRSLEETYWKGRCQIGEQRESSRMFNRVAQLTVELSRSSPTLAPSPLLIVLGLSSGSVSDLAELCCGRVKVFSSLRLHLVGEIDMRIMKSVLGRANPCAARVR